MTFSATVLDCRLPTEFLEYILHHYAHPTTVVVCSTRDTFLEQLHLSLHSEVAKHETPKEADGEKPISEKEEGKEEEEHPLLSYTIRTLARTSGVDLAFCPTLQHLRAYLAVYRREGRHDRGDDMCNTGNKDGRPTLALLNPIALHRHTSELSAQGISRTLATAVEAAVRTDMKLIMAELTELSEEEEEEAREDVDVAESMWDQEVPLLNRTVRGYGTDERAWMGRRVSLRRIAMRWFAFEHYLLDQRL